MESLQVRELPAGANWAYEPKWDGFRCVVFRDGDAVELQSKAGKPLARYFPEIVAAVQGVRASGFVLDGEIVLPVAGELSFEHLQLRLHPAASRVRKLAAELPALLILFDLLVDGDSVSCLDEPFSERRRRLERLAPQFPGDGAATLRVSPQTRDVETARGWLTGIKGGVDGVIAKRLDLPYMSDERAMRKIKRMRTADCVVGGFRYGAKGDGVGSLLLGLYDAGGVLHHVGFSSGIKTEEKPVLTRKLEKLIASGGGFSGNSPGSPSRWSTDRTEQWKALRPELVVEVEYDHFSEGRFRHGTRIVRWRPDKAPEQCSLEQVAKEGSASLELL
jgi:ATP-dependent DNA ligase